MFTFLVACNAEPIDRSIDNIDDGPIETPNTPSTIVNEQVEGRNLTIYIPPNYDSTKKYKTVYFLDGQSIWGTTWDLENKLNSLIEQNKIEPVIVVGIHNTSSRTSDMLPYLDSWAGTYEPNAEEFHVFTQDFIVPYVENNFASSRRKEDKAFFGYSYSGLHTMWTSITYDKWGMVASISPSFWVDNYHVFYDIQDSQIGNTKFWFDIGTAEWNYYVPVINLLSNKGVEYGKDAFYLEVPEGRHHGADWAKRIHNPLIVFAGISDDYSLVDWRIEVEFILSQSGTHYYKRINPIVTTANGIEYSASSKGSYELLNTEAGEVLEDGRFSFSGEEALVVKVSYKEFEETITINDIE